MNRVIVVGAGGHGQVVLDIIQAMNAQRQSMSVVGVVDDDPGVHGSTILGVPVVGPIEALRHTGHDAIVVAVGDNARRHALTSTLIGAGERLATVIHPAAVISPHSSINPGSMICAGAIVNPQTVVGSGAILNTGCSVDHHCRLDDYVHIAPGARLGGSVIVGREALIGIAAVVLPGRRIGGGATVGAGAVVTRDVPEGATVVGIPARAV